MSVLSFTKTDPKKRLTALDATKSEYFWEDPAPCEPHQMPKHERSHEFEMKRKRQVINQEWALNVP
jgi:cyclin-dependent kinase 12/13